MGRSNSNKTKQTKQTKQTIIDTAERLFAEKGIDGVTLFDINKSANQANRNALQYHFHNKQGLLEAVLNKHGLQIMAQRKEQLDALRAQQEFTLHEIMDALVQPLVDTIDDPDGGAAYINISGQLMVNPNYAELRKSRNSDLVSRLGLAKLMRKVTPKATPKVQQYRTIMVESLLYHSLSAFVSREANTNNKLPSKQSQKNFSEMMTDAVVDIMNIGK